MSTYDSDPESYFIVGYYVWPIAERLRWGPQNPHPERKGNYLTPVALVLLGLSTIAIALRLYSRAFIVRKLGLDDLLIIPGYLAAISLTAAQIKSLDAGWGIHVYDFQITKAGLLVLTGYVVQLSVGFCCLFTKLSILFSYLRFAPKGVHFGGLKRGFRFWCYAGMVFITSWTISLTMVLVFSCNPPHIYWEFFIRTPEIAAKCLSPYTVRTVQYAITCFNIVSDILILVLPIPTVWQLNLPVHEKWSCILILLIWILATIAAVLRLWVTIVTLEAFDSSWYGYDLWVYTSVEAQLAVTCACTPGIKPLISKIWPKLDKFRARDSVDVTDKRPLSPTEKDSSEFRQRLTLPKIPRKAWTSSQIWRYIRPAADIVTVVTPTKEPNEQQSGVEAQASYRDLSADADESNREAKVPYMQDNLLAQSTESAVTESTMSSNLVPKSYPSWSVNYLMDKDLPPTPLTPRDRNSK